MNRSKYVMYDSRSECHRMEQRMCEGSLPRLEAKDLQRRPEIFISAGLIFHAVAFTVVL